MYRAAESMVDEGRYGDAARLMRHAILSLPETTESDDLRHQLLMRLAHVQLRAADAEHDAAYAEDAASMLAAYGQHHMALFGDARGSEREDIYEMLYEAETFAETLTRAPRRSQAVSAKWATPSGPNPDVETHAGEDLEPEFKRSVRVRRGWFYDQDDPRIRQRLESSFSDPFAGAVLTKEGYAELSPPRPMVRASGNAERLGPAPPDGHSIRKLGRELLASSRPGLRDCYRGAAARGGKLTTEATVELAVRSDGSVHDVRVVDGDVVDGLGDACVIEELAGTTLTQNRHPTRMRLSILFFYDGPQMKYEGEREDLPRRRRQNTDISDFAVQPN